MLAMTLPGSDSRYWRLASFAQHLEEGTIDWSTVPVLDSDSYDDLREHGSAWRVRAVRIPASKLMDISNQAQKENPLRLEKMTEEGCEPPFYLIPSSFDLVADHGLLISDLKAALKRQPPASSAGGC